MLYSSTKISTKTNIELSTGRERDKSPYPGLLEAVFTSHSEWTIYTQKGPNLVNAHGFGYRQKQRFFGHDLTKIPSFKPRGFADKTRVSESRETEIWLRRVQRSVTDTKRRQRRGSAGGLRDWCERQRNNELVQVQAMEHLVRVVVGEWQRLAHGTWRFDMDHTQVKYDIVLRENETYGGLVARVRGKYRVLPSEPVALTYDFPEWMKVPGDYTTPPVDILEDKDVELFMAVRMDYVNLTLCVAYGNVEVGRYHTMQREEFGLTEDETDVVPPKPIPWRVSEEKLMTICSSEQMVEIRRNAVRLTRDEIFQPLMVIDENSPQTDSSDEMDIFTPNAEGMIRLEEIPTEPPAGANLTLAIATTNDVNGGRVGSYVKGKGVMTGPDIRGGQLFGLQMGSGSGFANTEGADVVLEEDEAYAGEQKVFVDRDAKKVHMSLHALANKYIYFVRKSEPGKVVLECSGVNYHWRVYATKITGCPRFEIKTLDSNHRCTVSERGQFRRHATSSIVGGMMRGKYVGTGSGPRPGALREMMRTDHSVPISYWTAWKSREISIENGRRNMSGALKRRRTCSICGGTDHNKLAANFELFAML
ncbi:hypothetical protein HID58_076754 [Brassica napus]|uniref:Transposase MuDR plant domain-containing protein n=1 Tax=Brassica napus TaxID=3708 RepID=A0ABQ7YNC2_BRANA|nr:hypothetical protein HID58_076754 [Brassica napus]